MGVSRACSRNRKGSTKKPVVEDKEKNRRGDCLMENSVKEEMERTRLPIISKPRRQTVRQEGGR